MEEMTGPEAHERIESDGSLMISIMDRLAAGVIVTDGLGTIQLLNRMAKEILDLGGERAVGQSAVELIARLEDVPHEVMLEKFSRIAERGESFSYDIEPAPPGGRFYALSLGPLRGPDRSILGIVAIVSDVTERREMAQMKTDLMSMVTREIRTPVATVRDVAQTLLTGGVGNEQATELLEHISRQSNRLVHLVSDFLDVTQIESRRRAVSRGPVDLDRLVQSAVADLKPLADERNITLQYQAPTGRLPEASGDRNLVEQVLINLISNAIKYSPNGARAHVAIAERNGQLAVSVQDNGLGVPEASMPHLFDKFYRVRCDDRNDVIGTGLGLSLAKQIIDMHGGTINVESEHGKGSTFTFTIPIHVEAREATNTTVSISSSRLRC